LPADRIRSLSAKFSALPSQAYNAQLAFVTIPSEYLAPDYANDSREEPRCLVEGRPYNSPPCISPSMTPSSAARSLRRASMT
ncbi:hypothetical protein GGI24_003189, partial [Coemansia furcata]